MKKLEKTVRQWEAVGALDMADLIRRIAGKGKIIFTLVGDSVYRVKKEVLNAIQKDQIQ